jgi:hypothetical protein
MLKATHAGKIQDHSFVIQVRLLGCCLFVSWPVMAALCCCDDQGAARGQNLGPQLRDPGGVHSVWLLYLSMLLAAVVVHKV